MCVCVCVCVCVCICMFAFVVFTLHCNTSVLYYSKRLDSV